MSWAAGEFSGESSYDSYFTTPAGHVGVTFLAASGDSGGSAGWPAVSPNVVAVGGTTLSLTSSATRSTETAWSGSSGGFSRYESEPSFQTGVQSSGKRSTPDVAYDANPNTGFAIYDSVSYDGQSGWFCVGGTSAGSPQWAGLIAVADQGRVLAGLGTLKSTDTSLYALPSSDFYDVTSGSNRGYRATTGYDEVTGLGAPLANLVIHNLVYGNGTTTGTSTAPTTTTTTPPVLTWNPLRRQHSVWPVLAVRRRCCRRAGRCIGCCRTRPSKRDRPGGSASARRGGAVPRRPVNRAAQLVGRNRTVSALGVTIPAGPGAATRWAATLTQATDSYFAELGDPQFGLTPADLPLVA